MDTFNERVYNKLCTPIWKECVRDGKEKSIWRRFQKNDCRIVWKQKANMWNKAWICLMWSNIVSLDKRIWENKNKKKNSYEEANEKLDKEIKEEYEKSKGRYGSPKIQKILEKRGIKASQKRVARRMKKMGLKSITVKKFKPSGRKGKVDDTNKPNLLAQNFKAEGLREKMVSDITYIYTKEKGWTYLAIVMDLYSLSVIGYSHGETMDAELVVKAIQNARAKGKFKKGAIFHSDLGSQYTSNKVEKYLKELELEHSYSKKGYPYDNASMESFNAILKKEEESIRLSTIEYHMN